VAAWHEPRRVPVHWLAFALYLAAMLGLLGIILWRLWTGLSPLFT
jgi:hypothetical protein